MSERKVRVLFICTGKRRRESDWMSLKHEDPQKRIAASGITIITEIETETVPCKWCDGDGLVMGVSDRFHTEISCVYCDGLGTLTRERERKYIVLPDGSKELLERES